jgi:SAM-dependent methyltransferase
MQNWGSGYVTDIEYEDGFYGALAPERLTLAATINGLESPVADGRFSYCELGCGRGQTSLVLAAINPEAEFHAVDFHPAHIAYAQSQAHATGLDNIAFHEASFEELTAARGASLPMFDFVTMHGVWSWISPALQESIVAFLNARLKPGGLVYVSYNTMPAWNQVAPLQRIVRELALASPERSDLAMSGALEQLGRLADAKIVPERFEEGLKRINDAQHRMLPYLAHEYLNEHWHPLYHSDVAGALSGAKLSFAGCTDLLKNFYNLALTEEQRAVLMQIPTAELRETLKDFCTDHWFRQDVFVRGARRMSAERRERLLAAKSLTLMRPAPDVIEISRPGGSHWRPDVTVYRAIMQALGNGPQSVKALLELDGLPPDHRVGPVELVGVLVGTGLADLYREPTAAERAGADKLNALIHSDEELALARGATLAVPSARSGITLSAANYALYRVLRRGETPDAEALAAQFIQKCHENGGHPVIDGKPIDNEKDALCEVTNDYVTKIERLVPIWRTIGLI